MSDLGITLGCSMSSSVHYQSFWRGYPILIVLSVFTISLDIGAYVGRSMIPEEDRFCVDFGALVEAMKRAVTI